MRTEVREVIQQIDVLLASIDLGEEDVTEWAFPMMLCLEEIRDRLEELLDGNWPEDRGRPCQ